MIKVVVPEPQFRGQTKQELGTPAVEKIAYDIVKQGLTDWFEGGGPKRHINQVRDKIANAVINRVSSKQLLETKRRAANMGSTGMPDKLADCRVHGPDSELIIVEGDSAAGPAKAGRNAEYMAILPLRGKVVNAGKATLKQVLDNAEAQALFTAMGAGSGKEFDLDAARYGRIVILCDADVDGSHIRCLLLTLIYEYMRPMLEGGRVFAAQPPLFSCRVGDTIHRAFSDKERDAVTARLVKNGRKAENIVWNRFKGLGEMNVEELVECSLDPETRILRRMTMVDAKEAKRAALLFDTLMGSDVAKRRDYLVANSSLLDPSALDV
jgi:DNA gyrase subunit B